MKKNKILIVILTLTFMLASCAMASNRASGVAEESIEMLAEAPAMEPRVGVEKMFADEAADSDMGMTSLSTDVERIVIKNASLSIVVADPIDSMESISDMAEEMGGFVVNSYSYKTTTSQGLEVPTANITVRVPAEKLDEAIEQIKAMVEDADLDILNEDISGQDVTGEVTDLESRLRNLEAAETQLLEIMENAYDTEDVITIFRELTSIREEIEVIQGQIKYYRESASLSAVSVYLQAKEAMEPITIGGWQPGLEAQKALQALVQGGKYIVNMLIWLLIFAIPILAIIFLPVYFLLKFLRNRKHKKDDKKEDKKPEDKKK